MNKTCNLKMVGKKCFFNLINCSNDELIEIVDYKSWILRSYKVGKERKYFVYIYKDRENEKVVWTSIGFSSLLVRYLESLGYVVSGKELFKSRKILVGKPYYNLWDFQSEAVDSWVNSGGCGIIKAPTGSGKSIVACNIISRLDLRTIICVHTSDLLINVWYNNITEQFSEVIKSKIGIIGGGLTKKQRMKMRINKNVSFDSNINKDIVIATTQSLISNLDKLSNEDFGLMIYDEAHHSPANQFNKVVSSVRAPYRLGLSGTLTRPDGMSPMIYGLIGSIVYNISIKELVRKGFLVEPVFKAIVINDESIQQSISNSGYNTLKLGMYVNKMSAGSEIKKNYILNLISGLHVNNKRFLLYSDYVTPKDGVFTRDYYVNELNKNGIRVIGVSSKMNSNDREYVFNMLKKGEIDGLVFGRLGAEGVNIPEVDSVVMCNATRSTIMFPQRVGRSMRKTNDSKRYAYIYEVLLNTPLELGRIDDNFHEYKSEGYHKEIVYLNNKE